MVQPYGVLSMGTGGGKSKTTVGAETVAQLVEKANCEAYRIICEGQYLCAGAL